MRRLSPIQDVLQHRLPPASTRLVLHTRTLYIVQNSLFRTGQTPISCSRHRHTALVGGSIHTRIAEDFAFLLRHFTQTTPRQHPSKPFLRLLGPTSYCVGCPSSSETTASSASSTPSRSRRTSWYCTSCAFSLPGFFGRHRNSCEPHRNVRRF